MQPSTRSWFRPLSVIDAVAGTALEAVSGLMDVPLEALGGPTTRDPRIPDIYDFPTARGVSNDDGMIQVGALGDDPMDWLDPAKRAEMERQQSYQSAQYGMMAAPMFGMYPGGGGTTSEPSKPQYKYNVTVRKVKRASEPEDEGFDIYEEWDEEPEEDRGPHGRVYVETERLREGHRKTRPRPTGTTKTRPTGTTKMRPVGPSAGGSKRRPGTTKYRPR